MTIHSSGNRKTQRCDAGRGTQIAIIVRDLAALDADSKDLRNGRVGSPIRETSLEQLHGLDLSIVPSTSPLRAGAIIPLTNFHEVSRAEGPK